MLMTKGYFIDLEATRQDAEFIATQLTRHNTALTGVESAEPLNILVRSPDGSIVGGVKAATCFGWLYVSDIWLEESVRRQGLGSKMMHAAETRALERGCARAWLTTFSFQARPFYEQLGYHVFSELEQYPGEVSLYFMRKSL